MRKPIVTELHKHKTRGLLDVLRTARGARWQPLLWIITTAGDTVEAPGVRGPAVGGIWPALLMGEDGPELVMPLKRGPDGKLILA